MIDSKNVGFFLCMLVCLFEMNLMFQNFPDRKNRQTNKNVNECFWRFLFEMKLNGFYFWSRFRFKSFFHIHECWLFRIINVFVFFCCYCWCCCYYCRAMMLACLLALWNMKQEKSFCSRYCLLLIWCVCVCNGILFVIIDAMPVAGWFTSNNNNKNKKEWTRIE